MKTKIVTLQEVKKALADIDVDTLIAATEQGFVAYSEGRTIIPPVGHLQFSDPPGDAHIKYGYIPGDAIYVVKVASSFYDNPKLGVLSSNGTMLVFSQKTGELLSVLLDEGYLTDVRTALAGAVVARYLAPSSIEGIGIVGTGTQARLQLEYLKGILHCDQVYVWGRSDDSLRSYVLDMNHLGLAVTPTRNIRDVTMHCNYIVTTTPSKEPIIMAEDVRPGTHITAVGADSPGKQELDPTILGRADMVIVDSKSQCIDHGETGYAIRQDLIKQAQLTELGALIKNGLRRENDTQITIADLTGVAVQDIQLAAQVYGALFASS